MSAELISVVITCYNPGLFVRETIESVERQTHTNWEIIVVDDGSEDPSGVALLDQLDAQNIPRVRFLRVEHTGLPKARNTGFAEARGRYVIPLDCDDLLEPNMMEVCLRELEQHAEAGYAYFDYRVFGKKNYVERPGRYNLYRLLNENFMAHCIFLRRDAWEDAGGYDEWHLWAYEDWHLFLQLSEKGWHGHYIPRVLFNYRTHHIGHHYTGLEHHDKNWAHLVESRPALLSPQGRLRVKQQWQPSICFVVRGPRVPSFENQTVRDYQVLVDVDESMALRDSKRFLFLVDDRRQTASTLRRGRVHLSAAVDRLGHLDGHRGRSAALDPASRRALGFIAPGFGNGRVEAFGPRQTAPVAEPAIRESCCRQVQRRRLPEPRPPSRRHRGKPIPPTLQPRRTRCGLRPFPRFRGGRVVVQRLFSARSAVICRTPKSTPWMPGYNVLLDRPNGSSRYG